MKRFVKKAAVAVVIVLVVFGIYRWTTGNYNKSVALAHNVETNWADVVEQLNRRYDLVPNLVEEVKKFAKDETALYRTLDEKRQAYSLANGKKEKLQAAQELEGALAKLLQIADKYPKLKADGAFLKLADDLAGFEKSVTFEEKKYNENVQMFKKYKGSLFGGIFMKFAGLSDKDYEEIRVFAAAGSK